MINAVWYTDTGLITRVYPSAFVSDEDLQAGEAGVLLTESAVSIADDFVSDVTAFDPQIAPRPELVLSVNGSLVSGIPGSAVIESGAIKYPCPTELVGDVQIRAPAGQYPLRITAWPHKEVRITVSCPLGVESTLDDAQIITLNPYDDLATCIESCKTRIDTAAGQARARYITTDPGQAETYAEKEKDAKAFVLATNGPWASHSEAQQSQLRQNHPWVAATADARDITPPSAAVLILATAQQWRAKGIEIEQARETAKHNIGQAPDQITAANITTTATQMLENL